MITIRHPAAQSACHRGPSRSKLKPALISCAPPVSCVAKLRPHHHVPPASRFAKRKPHYHDGHHVLLQFLRALMAPLTRPASASVAGWPSTASLPPACNQHVARATQCVTCCVCRTRGRVAQHSAPAPLQHTWPHDSCSHAHASQCRQPGVPARGGSTLPGQATGLCVVRPAPKAPSWRRSPPPRPAHL